MPFIRVTICIDSTEVPTQHTVSTSVILKVILQLQNHSQNSPIHQHILKWMVWFEHLLKTLGKHKRSNTILVSDGCWSWCTLMSLCSLWMFIHDCDFLSRMPLTVELWDRQTDKAASVLVGTANVSLSEVFSSERARAVVSSFPFSSELPFHASLDQVWTISSLYSIRVERLVGDKCGVTTCQLQPVKGQFLFCQDTVHLLILLWLVLIFVVLFLWWTPSGSLHQSEKSLWFWPLKTGAQFRRIFWWKRTPHPRYGVPLLSINSDLQSWFLARLTFSF